MKSARWHRVLLLTGLLVPTVAATPLRAGEDPLSDQGTTLQAKLALLASPALGRDALAIDVDTLYGLVTLHGNVSTPAARAEAETTVSALAGVTGVRNLLALSTARLAVDEPANVRNDVLAAEVTEALLAEPFAFGDVRVAPGEDGLLTLEGSVRQASDELAALRAAQRVPGVRAVQDRLTVNGSRAAGTEAFALAASHNAGRSTAAHDAALTHDVKRQVALAIDGAAARDVCVDTADGIVTLFGTVPCDEMRLTAAAAASRVGGTREVRDALCVDAVALASPSAAEQGLAEIVRQSLAEQRRHISQQALDAIRIDVSAGVVRLQGDVPSSPERMLAGTIASSVDGVRGVRNELTVSAEEPPDHQVAQR